ncbi:MAG: DUF1700 domain-containing protein [Oscillospiraceae bacterium]|nr:DUF1700 domain-containing protein [Oscillospiraceae bacterium]
MNKETFLTKLTEALSFMDPAERNRTVQYYREILEDRVEDGLREADAVAEMEPVAEIAARLRAENGPPTKKKRPRWETVLLIAGFPLWFPLLLAAGCVFFALFIAAWSVILALFSVTAALALCLIAGIGCLFLLLTSGYPLTGLFLLGVGLFCAALGIALFIPVLALSRLLIRGVSRLFRFLRGKLISKKEGFA